MQRSAVRMAGFVFRENRVPHYQRLFQRVDGVRQWNKTPRSKYYLYPYYIALGGSMAASLYAMGRLIAGKKTFF